MDRDAIGVFIDKMLSFRALAVGFFVLAAIWSVIGDYPRATCLAAMAIYMRVCAVEEALTGG